MAIDIDDAFVKQYESEVHTAYQRRGSLLKNTVRYKNNVTGESTTFQKVGTGTATTKSRNGNVVPMNVDHTPVECTLADYYAPEYVDALDELKINHNEREVMVNAGAFALGRKTDDLIITALDGATTHTDSWNLSATAIGDLTDNVIALGSRNVPIEPGETFGVVSWQLWGKLMGLTQFASGDYVGMDLPFKQAIGPARMWMGVIWMPHSGLTINGSNVRTNFIYHRTAVGHASGQEVKTMIDWIPEKVAHLVNGCMSQGSVLIDTIGVQQLLVTESA